jgi:hypothetical protein
MPHPDLTEVVVVLDRSGSMVSTRVDMEGAFDAFVAEQLALPGQCKVTLVQFDTVVELVYEGLPLARVPRLSLVPRGGTALFDGIGLAVDSVSRRLHATPDAARPARVLAVIITDGGENSSRVYSHDGIFARIQKKREIDGWEFVYLGANQDAFATGQALGIDQAYGYVSSPAGTHDLMDGVSQGVRDFRQGQGYTAPGPSLPLPKGNGNGGGRKLN